MYVFTKKLVVIYSQTNPQLKIKKKKIFKNSPEH